MGNTCLRRKIHEDEDGVLNIRTGSFWQPNDPEAENTNDESSLYSKFEGKREKSPLQPLKFHYVIRREDEIRSDVHQIPAPEKMTMIVRPEAKIVEPLHPKKNIGKESATMSLGLQVDSVLRIKTGHLKEHYTLGNKLGEGKYGTTFVCIDKKTGKNYACKSIAKRRLLTDDDINSVRKEIEIMYHLSGHENIISIQGAYEDTVAVHVIMEICEGGELFDRVVERRYYPEEKAAGLIRKIVGVVEICHSYGVMHLDLKPENFLFLNKDEDSVMKTIDFGMSVFFKPGQVFKRVAGSPFYLAPEVLDKYYGPEADIWSAGVILYILLSGYPPFYAEIEEELFDQILSSDINFSTNPWPDISDAAKDLVKKMLVRDPRKRITVHQILCHSWVVANGVAPNKPLDHIVLRRFRQFSDMNCLMKMVFKVIAQGVSDVEIGGCREMFAAVDIDADGYITFWELKTWFKRLGINLDESEMHHLMEAVDLDKNGVIDYWEFVAATLNLNIMKKEYDVLRAFSVMDMDGDGVLTEDEVQTTGRRLGMKASSHLVREAFQEIDQNNDGKIDRQEFIQMIANQQALNF